MIVLLVSAVAWSGGHEVQAQRVDGLNPAGGYLEVRLVDGRPSLFVADGQGTSFVCHARFPSGYIRKALTKYADLVDEVGAAVRAGKRMSFDPALTGITSTQAEGYCNVIAATEPNPAGDGVLGFVAIRYNRACFGSAGCNADTVGMALDAEQAAAVSAALRWGTAPEKP